MKIYITIAAFMIVLIDILAYQSVPIEVRKNHQWALIPCGGYVLAVEYHFGNKLK